MPIAKKPDVVMLYSAPRVSAPSGGHVYILIIAIIIVIIIVDIILIIIVIFIAIIIVIIIIIIAILIFEKSKSTYKACEAVTQCQLAESLRC